MKNWNLERCIEANPALGPRSIVLLREFSDFDSGKEGSTNSKERKKERTKLRNGRVRKLLVRMESKEHQNEIVSHKNQRRKWSFSVHKWGVDCPVQFYLFSRSR